jgi:hypothetical protein
MIAPMMVWISCAIYPPSRHKSSTLGCNEPVPPHGNDVGVGRPVDEQLRSPTGSRSALRISRIAINPQHKEANGG